MRRSFLEEHKDSEEKQTAKSKIENKQDRIHKAFHFPTLQLLLTLTLFHSWGSFCRVLCFLQLLPCH
jgi:hypothetical protein